MKLRGLDKVLGARLILRSSHGKVSLPLSGDEVVLPPDLPLGRLEAWVTHRGAIRGPLHLEIRGNRS